MSKSRKYEDEYVRKDIHNDIMAPGGIIEEVEAQVDKEGLIDASILNQIMVIPIGSRKKRTNAHDCSDKEFVEWFLEQLCFDGECTKELQCRNRLKIRLLMVACLRYAKNVQYTHWRDPKPKEEWDTSKLDDKPKEVTEEWLTMITQKSKRFETE